MQLQGELVTSARGQPILQSLPGLSPTELSTEPWMFAEQTDAEGLSKRDAWHRKKVMNDIRKFTARSFPCEQQDQWAALDGFHDAYTTSDSVPALPFSVRGEQQNWEFSHGTPFDWRGAFAKLTLRHDRS